jgi:Uma2 family endonuclease
MGMPVSKVPTTADELEAIPEDGNRYEIIDGVLFVTPAPSTLHQRTLLELVERLRPYGKALGLELLVAPIDVRASSSTQVQPDILVLPRFFEGRRKNRWEQMSRLLLAVEILSPSSKRLDQVLKRKTYLEHGEREYWVVDADNRSIDVWTVGHDIAHIMHDAIRWHPLPDQPALAVDLIAMFNEVHEGE